MLNRIQIPNLESGFPYRYLHITFAVSIMRFEKPHSLSYQETMRHKRLSMTVVCVTSKDELNGLWLKSMDTRGSSTTPRMPFNLPLAALRIRSLISSTVVSRAALNTRSTKETFEVGTRIAVPSSLPLSSG